MSYLHDRGYSFETPTCRLDCRSTEVPRFKDYDDGLLGDYPPAPGWCIVATIVLAGLVALTSLVLALACLLVAA